MEIRTKYVVFEYDTNDRYSTYGNVTLSRLALASVYNSFDSEEDAIKALIDNEIVYSKCVILKEIYITR